MESREEKLNQMKQEYQNHHMSEEQVNEMKKKIEQRENAMRGEKWRQWQQEWQSFLLFCQILQSR